MDVAAWIDENRAFLEEAVEVLAPFASVPTAVNLLYRHRALAPQRFLQMPEEEEMQPLEEYIPTPTAAPERPKAAAGTSWNKVASMEAVPETPKQEEAPPEEPDEELLKVLQERELLAQQKAFEDETRKSELLLEVMENIKEIAMRHNCCYGVHSNSFLYALGDLVA